MKTKIGVGRTAEVFDYDDGKVVKLFYENISDEEVNLEYSNNKVIESLDIPSAKCFGIMTYNNRKGLIMEKLNGCSMMKAMETKPMNSMSFAVPLAKTQYELHKPIHVKLPSNKEQLFSKIAAVGMLSNSTKDTLYSYINSLKDEAVLCHSDYHPENVFITDEKLIVFDWSTATIGNRFSDVAHTNLLLRYGVSPDTKNAIALFITNKVRNLYADKYLKEYIQLSKCSKNDIFEWEIPNMAAMLNDFLTEKTALYFLKQIERFVHKIS